MPKKQTQFTFRYIFYKYDISEAQDGSEAEYEILHTEIINNGFWILDLSWLDDEVHHVELGEFDCCAELPMGQVHEIVVNVEPWSEYDQYNGDWDGGVYWHDVAHRRLTGRELKEFLIGHPRCNRLHGLEEENTFKEHGGDGCCHSMRYEIAIDSTDVPEELKHLPDDTLNAMVEYFKKTFTKYVVGERG